MSPLTPQARTSSVAAALAALVVAAYSRVGGNGFVDFDDGAYVYDNPVVREGLSADGVAWAFTAAHSANWHPLTWLSHMLDVSVFGLDPGAHHWVSVLLHALNTVLLFLVLRGLTGALWRAAFAAALFGLHPLHVESVAWIAERKDVLSALFWLLAIGAYARYARQPSRERYLVVAAAFALGLLSKPMVVTLPAVLLLLDAWPLGRWSPTEPRPWTRLRPLLVEKLPLFALSLVSSVVTWYAQSASAATGTLSSYPLVERLSNAVVSYGTYLAKTVWPASLGVFYPHPSTLGEGVQVGPLVASAAALVTISVVAARQAARRPYLAFGWLWYLGTLVPVIGIVQVGSQACADRCTYLPLIGVFVVVAWGLGELVERRPELRAGLAAATGAVLLALGAAIWVQTGYWSDSVTLYRRTIAVEGRSWLAWNNLGNQHLGRGELDRAMECFQEALRIFPGYGEAWYNAGNVHMQRMDREPAVAAYQRALELDGGNLDAWNNLGVAFLNLGRYPEAIANFESALRIEPRHGASLENLALTYAMQRDGPRFEDACRRLRAADPAREAALRAKLSPPR